MKKEVIEN